MNDSDRCEENMMQKDKRYFDARVGNLEQLAYARRSVMSDGRADGLRIIEVNNGNGLSCTLLEGRCLDIARLSYKGTNLSFLSKAGFVAPSQCNTASGEFAHYFQGGMLYTCGIDNFGPDGKKNGNALLLHGCIGITPAQEVSTFVDWENKEIKISGKMVHAGLFNENLELYRTITIPMDDNQIRIHDTITNHGFADEEIMLLYHINFGYPMLSEDLELDIKGTVKPRDQDAADGIAHWNTFETPTAGRPEEVYYHTPNTEEDGLVHVNLTNKRLNIGAEVIFDLAQLPYLVQWKSMMSGDYALGIEPATAYVGGYEQEKKEGRMVILKPGAKKEFDVALLLSDLN
ncbi:MAG: aldose 1-epimerase family protein [Clostridiales bacterium]|nr:aldose 1-epimerase family protein [Clostridiales bacterium]